MPELVIKTNLPKSKFPANFISEMTKIVAGTLGKPEKKICLTVFNDVWMSFAGTEEPCASCSLTSVGKLGPEENIAHAKAIMTYLYKQLGIDDQRMYLSFHNSAKEDMGFQGTTVGEILKSK